LDKANDKERYLKSSPFNTVGGDTKFTACVGTNGGYTQFTINTGFKDAVNTLVGSIDNYENCADPLVYPILFCIRHSIELCLKEALAYIKYIVKIKSKNATFRKLMKASKINAKLEERCDNCNLVISKGMARNFDEVERFKRKKTIIQNRSIKIKNIMDLLNKEIFGDGEREKYTHDIDELVEDIIKIYEVDDRIKEAFDKLLPLLREYRNIDPDGAAFRYLNDKNGSPFFETKKISIVRIDILAIQFEEISKLFDELGWFLFYITKEYNTFTYTKALSRQQIEKISKTLPSPENFAKKYQK